MMLRILVMVLLVSLTASLALKFCGSTMSYAHRGCGPYHIASSHMHYDVTIWSIVVLHTGVNKILV